MKKGYLSGISLGLLIVVIVIALVIYSQNKKNTVDDSFEKENNNPIYVPAQINITDQENPKEQENTNVREENLDEFSRVNEIHWTHMPLTYYIDFSRPEDTFNGEPYQQKLLENKKLRVKKALEKIHNAIPEISFVESDIGVDLLILGEIPAEVRVESNKGTECLSGYACNTEALAISNRTGNIINNAVVYFPEALREDVQISLDSSTEVHEILHTFGVKHLNVYGGVMWETTGGYNLQIEDMVISCLKKIYSNNNSKGDCSNVLIKTCAKGDILGQDYKCHKECGKGYYCVEGSFCEEGRCYECAEGYYLGEDEVCYLQE